MNKNLFPVLYLTGILLTAITPSMAVGQEPSKIEMLKTMQQAAAERGGVGPGVNLRDIEKLGCNRMAKSTYRCAYRVEWNVNCEINPIACFATAVGGGTVNERTFTRYGQQWIMSK